MVLQSEWQPAATSCIPRYQERVSEWIGNFCWLFVPLWFDCFWRVNSSYSSFVCINGLYFFFWPTLCRYIMCMYILNSWINNLIPKMSGHHAIFWNNNFRSTPKFIQSLISSKFQLTIFKLRMTSLNEHSSLSQLPVIDISNESQDMVDKLFNVPTIAFFTTNEKMRSNSPNRSKGLQRSWLLLSRWPRNRPKYD